MEKNPLSRRRFLEHAAIAGAAGTIGMQAIITGCTSREKVVLPVPLDAAPDGPELKAGLIGCGGRGSGAAIDFLSAGPNLKVTALGDVFQDRLDETRDKLLDERQNEVADDHCFIGFDAFEKVIDSGVDVVILATPPVFRPEHFDAAIKAGKHVFMEKPVAVDPVGIRSIMATGKRAETTGLCVVAGTQRRHQRHYMKAFEHIANGQIGDIVSANVYWNGGKLWHRNRQPDWSDMEWMIRDWVNWCWLSGDHIVEQHVHNIDVVNWFTGKHPVSAVGFGSRHRRITGDQYDNFSVDFVYDDEMHMHSMCRQINDCANSVSEYIRGTKGYLKSASGYAMTMDPQGETIWEYEFPLDEEGVPSSNLEMSPYRQEHIDLVAAIRNNQPINEAESVAVSTLTAIMGRVSAYTGKLVTWEEMMNSDLKLGPEVYVMGPMDLEPDIPVPGSAPQNI